MSRDDGIYIGYFRRDTTSIYAVACAIAIDNLKYNEEMGRYDDYVHYVRQNWGNGPFFSTLEKAKEYAVYLQKIEKTEYGIRSVGKFKCPLNDDDTLPRMDTWEPESSQSSSSKTKKNKFYVRSFRGVVEENPFDSFEDAKEYAKEQAVKYPGVKIEVFQTVYSVVTVTRFDFIEE